MLMDLSFAMLMRKNYDFIVKETESGRIVWLLGSQCRSRTATVFQLSQPNLGWNLRLHDCLLMQNFYNETLGKAFGCGAPDLHQAQEGHPSQCSALSMWYCGCKFLCAACVGRHTKEVFQVEGHYVNNEYQCLWRVFVSTKELTFNCACFILPSSY